jgi:hypothetical protein
MSISHIYTTYQIYPALGPWDYEINTFGKGLPAHSKYAFSFKLLSIALKILHINTIYQV